MTTKDPAGRNMITVGTNPTNVAPDHKATIADADAGLDALVEAAEVLDSNLHAGINELIGVQLFKT
ncbi:hypothetical protein [Microbacterium sp. CH12i]|uniref:hypothetical protein n=1 Tax=Microbacterium sp. CH12i TaxID=1479651 RepID=UPI000B024AE6|nr:hypothetical protein [Microbacterium sp. CH12i]